MGMLQESKAIFYHPLDASGESLQSREWVFGAGTHSAAKLSLGVVAVAGAADFSLRMGLEDFGSESEFHSAGSADWISIGVISATKIIVAFSEASANYYGKALVGTISGTDITWGSKFTFNAAWTNEISVAVLDSTKFVVVYQDYSGADEGESCVGTVSGTDITWGTEIVFSGAVAHLNVVKTASDEVVICFTDEADANHGTAMVGTVSGTNITWGAQHEFLSTGAATQVDVAAVDSAKFVVVYQNGSASFDGCAKVGTVSGTDITFGAQSTYYTGPGGSYNNRVVKLDSSHVAVASNVYLNSKGSAKVGTVSGTGLTWGSEHLFLSDSPGAEDIGLIALSSTKIVVFYRDGTDGDKGKGREGTVSGTDITWSAAVNFLDTVVSYLAPAMLDSLYFVVGYRDDDNSYYGTVKVGQSLLDSYPTAVAEERIAFCGWYKKPSV